MYRHGRVNEMTQQAGRIVSALFGMYTAHPEQLPPEWRSGDVSAHGTVRRVADFIAGMTDRYAIDDHQRILGLKDK